MDLVRSARHDEKLPLSTTTTENDYRSAQDDVKSLHFTTTTTTENDYSVS